MPSLSSIFRLRWSMSWYLAAAMVTLMAVVMLVVTWVEIRRERALTRMDLEQQALALSGTMEDVLQNPLYSLDVNRVDATISTAVKSSTSFPTSKFSGPMAACWWIQENPTIPRASWETLSP